MLKHIEVPIIVDDHEPEKCGKDCQFRDCSYCILCDSYLNNMMRCKRCMEEAK